MQPKLVAALFMSVGAIAPTAPAWSTEISPTQTAAVSRTPQQIIVTIQGLTLAAATATNDGLEAALSFNEPIQEALAKEIPSLIGAPIDVSTGYDSMLVRASSPSEFLAREIPNGFSLTIRIPEGKPDQFRLAVAELRRRTLSGDTDGARAALVELRRYKPQDQELLRLDADIDVADGNFASASKKLEVQLAANPDDPSLKQSFETARAQLAPRLEAGINTRKIEKADKQTSSYAQGDFPISPDWRLRGRVDYLELDDNQVRQPNGSIAPAQEDEILAKLDIDYNFAPRWTGQLSAFGASESIGAGAGIRYRDASSSVELLLAYRMPSWDFPETIAHDGTHDMASLALSRTWENTWQVSLTAQVHRYALGSDEDAAITSSIDGGIRWFIPLENQAQFTLGYTVDTEFVQRATQLPDGGGGFYQLIPVADRITHTLDARLAGTIADKFYASALLGYSIDDAGEKGIVSGAELTFAPSNDLRLALTANYSGVASRSGESGAYMYAGLTVVRILSSNGSADEP